ncbi:hypothetical protein EVAR_96538_1 [Eumeta japonica]|uniref:Uncharacterized protein n=1 Tax=Eumeta variegata TaxID=151549 RepID=A0A4C1WEC7_EUMVA|nr:hypothetical protein EVAR_96538_1 [Eumeta japonica]
MTGSGIETKVRTGIERGRDRVHHPPYKNADLCAARYVPTSTYPSPEIYAALVRNGLFAQRSGGAPAPARRVAASFQNCVVIERRRFTSKSHKWMIFKKGTFISIPQPPDQVSPADLHANNVKGGDHVRVCTRWTRNTWNYKSELHRPVPIRVSGEFLVDFKATAKIVKKNQRHEYCLDLNQFDIPTRPVLFCPVRLVYDTQALVMPGDEARPAQVYYFNTSNHVPNSIVTSPFSYGNNYQIASQQVGQSVAMPNAFSEMPDNDRSTTNMNHSSAILNMNVLSDTFGSCNPIQNFQRDTGEVRIRQDNPTNSFSILPPTNHQPGQIYFVQKVQQNCVQRNVVAQSALSDDAPHQRVVQPVVLGQEVQKEAQVSRGTGQQVEKHKLKPQQNFMQRHLSGQKIVKQNVQSQGMVQANFVHPSVTQQNLYQKSMLQQRTSLMTPRQKTPEQVCPSPTVVLPLQSSCISNRHQIIMNPKKSDQENTCATTQAIKLKNLPPWVAKQMGLEPDNDDAQKVPETMNPYITVDSEEIKRLDKKKAPKFDVGSQVNAENLKETENKPVRKRGIDSEDGCNTASKHAFIEAEAIKIVNLTNDATSYDLLRTYLKKPEMAKNSNFYREVQKHAISENGTTNERLKNDEITSTTLLEESKGRESDHKADVRYRTRKASVVCRVTNSTCVDVRSGEPLRNDISKAEASERQNDDAISCLSVDTVKRSNATERVECKIEKQDGTENGDEQETRTNVKGKRSCVRNRIKKAAKTSDRKGSISQTKTANRSMEKDRTGDAKRRNIRKNVSKQGDFFKRTTRRSSKLQVDDNANAVNGEFPNFNENVTGSDSRIGPPDGSTDKEERYVLTHVIEGIVIQESNYPFPITPKILSNFFPNMERNGIYIGTELDSKAEPGLKSKTRTVSGWWLSERSVEINDEIFDVHASGAAGKS